MWFSSKIVDHSLLVHDKVCCVLAALQDQSLKGSSKIANKMIYELLLFVVSSGALATLGIVLYTIVVCRLTHMRFKKESRGLPLLPDRRLLGNHVSTWPMRKNLCEEIRRVTEEMFSTTKTIGWCYRTHFAAFTVDLNLIKLFIHDEPNKHVNRMKYYLPLKEYEDSIMSAEGDKWRKLRRHFAPALKPNRFKTPNVMLEIENSINKFIGMIDHKLDEQRGISNDPKHRFELDDIVHRFTLNTVFSCLYKQTNMINFDDKRCEWTENIDGLLDNSFQRRLIVNASILVPILRPVIDWLAYHFHQQGKLRRTILGFVKSQARLNLDARREFKELSRNNSRTGGIDPDNFVLRDGRRFTRNMIDYIVDSFLDGKLTKDEYVDSSCFLFGAADKTAADCIVNTLYHLGRNLDSQERLRESIKSDGVDSEYLSWVIHESLRLMPPVPTSCSRTITRDIEIENGHVLPKGTFVVTCAYVIHRLKEYWGEDAEEFRPERWADASNFHPMQYIAFGAGPRGCLGREFALHEIRLVMSALLTRYRFECDHKPDLNEFDSPFLIYLIPHSPTYLTIKPL